MELNVWLLVVGVLLLYAWVFLSFPPFTNALLVVGLVLIVLGVLIKPKERAALAPVMPVEKPVQPMSGTVESMGAGEVGKVKCPYCGNLYDDALDVCPHCGAKR